MLHVDASPRDFATAAFDWLATDPVRNNVLCSVVEARLAAARRTEDGALWLRLVEDGAPVAAAIRTPPRGLLLSATTEPGAQRLAELLVDADLTDLPGVSGPVPAVDGFARRYTELVGCATTVFMDTRMFTLTEVVAPAGVPGEARRATQADREVLVAWAAAFAAELHEDRGDPAEPVDDRLPHGDLLWLWEDGGRCVSTAWLSPPVAGVIRVGGVYTPPELRGRGYASGVVAAASGYALTRGRACMLYTDQANPTSNKIYQLLGYRAVGDARAYDFRAAG
jgi:predicted GNAT family acetyltransferase